MSHNRKFDAEKSYRLRDVARILIAVTLIAIAFSSAVLVRWAEERPAGAWRDFGLAVTMPVHEFASALGLDIPQKTITAWFESIDGVLENETPPQPAAGDAEMEADNEDRVYTPLRPLSLLCFGDSNIAEAVGGAIQRELASNRAVRIYRLGKYSTGLSRLDFFDWQRQLVSMFAVGHYDAAVLMIGENDAQDFEDGGRLLRHGTAEWYTVYERRFRAMLDLLTAKMTRVVVIGIPPMREKGFDRRMAAIDRIYRAVTADYPGVEFVDTVAVLGDENGGYRHYMTLNNNQVAVRVSDGIHISDAGARLIAPRVAMIILESFQFGVDAPETADGVAPPPIPYTRQGIYKPGPLWSPWPESDASMAESSKDGSPESASSPKANAQAVPNAQTEQETQTEPEEAAAPTAPPTAQEQAEP